MNILKMNYLVFKKLRDLNARIYQIFKVKQNIVYMKIKFLTCNTQTQWPITKLLWSARVEFLNTKCKKETIKHILPPSLISRIKRKTVMFISLCCNYIIYSERSRRLTKYTHSQSRQFHLIVLLHVPLHRKLTVMKSLKETTAIHKYKEKHTTRWVMHEHMNKQTHYLFIWDVTWVFLLFWKK
jgi:hypothetical protein